MKSAEIKELFAQTGSQLPRLAGTSDTLASWIEQKMSSLTPHDLKFLIPLGAALYAAEAEQKWKDAWGK